MSWIRRKLLELALLWHEANLERLVAEQADTRRKRERIVARLEELQRRALRASARRQIKNLQRRGPPGPIPKPLPRPGSRTAPRLAFPPGDTQ